MSSVPSLGDVPEEEALSPTSSHLDYSPESPTIPATSVLGGTAVRVSKKAPSIRTLGRSSSDALPPNSSKKVSSSSTATKDARIQKAVSTTALKKTRSTPRLPHDKDAEPAPSTSMYWSRAPVYGTIPPKFMRGHSVTLVDAAAWLFGGCDDKDLKENVRDMRIIYCFDTETMQWSQRDTIGEIPPPCRAHTVTLVDRKLVVFGGGYGPTYYDSVFVLDTHTRTWTRPTISGPAPACRRAHTAVLYQQKIWIFGGGNGMTALNDVWTLDVSSMSKMKWQKIETSGRRPDARGYHSANLIGNVMIVIGGSNGKDLFTDIWLLNLDKRAWSQVQLGQTIHRRIAHSATQVGSYLFVIGGHNSTDYCSEVLLFNLVSLSYEQRPVLGKAPSGRGYHATVLADSRIFLFGGSNGSNTYDDVYILDLAAGAYLPQVTSFNVDF